MVNDEFGKDGKRDGDQNNYDDDISRKFCISCD